MSKSRCSDEYPAHDSGGCPNCAPRIVAECWTCERQIKFAEQDAHLSAGHRVWTVQKTLARFQSVQD